MAINPTYTQNYEVAINTSLWQTRLAMALTKAANDILSEAYTGLSVPAGYYPDAEDGQRKKMLHFDRAALSNSILNNPLRYGARFAYDMARALDLYIDDSGSEDQVNRGSTEAAVLDSDIDWQITQLFTNWATAEHGDKEDVDPDLSSESSESSQSESSSSSSGL